MRLVTGQIGCRLRGWFSGYGGSAGIGLPVAFRLSILAASQTQIVQKVQSRTVRASLDNLAALFAEDHQG